MFQACGNSYINAWLQDWLERARDAGVYDGPVVGRIAELDIDEIWLNSYRKAGASLEMINDVFLLEYKA